MVLAADVNTDYDSIQRGPPYIEPAGAGQPAGRWSRWAAILHLGYLDGKRKRKYFYGKKRSDVQAKLTAPLRAQQEGLPILSENQTVGLWPA